LDNRVQTSGNWEGVNKRFVYPRPLFLLSRFPETVFRAFQASDFRAKDKDDIIIDIVPVISGLYQNNYFSARKTKFGNLDLLTDSTIAPTNPDLCYSTCPEQLDRQVRDKLSSRIILSTIEDKPIAPNFYLEAKGPDRSLAVAIQQACYNRVLGTRGIQSLQLYRQDNLVYNNNIYTITSIYYSRILKIYTTYITLPAGPGKLPEYYITQVRLFAITDTADTFCQGTTAFRNSRELAKE
jgi:hypothetical protein